MAAGTAVELSDLGPDLLHRIFCKVGPSPLHLAPLACVCRQWRAHLQNRLWKQLCLQHMPGLCKEMGYTEQARDPPGGWLGLYKFVLYCPGVFPPLYVEAIQRNHDMASVPNPLSRWWRLLGHVTDQCNGLVTGATVPRELIQALFPEMRDDVLFFSRPCDHSGERAGEVEGEGSERLEKAKLVLSWRGLVKDFSKSAFALRIGASSNLGPQCPTWKQVEQSCSFCQAPLFALSDDDAPHTVQAIRILSLSEEERWTCSFAGHVCGEGHVVVIAAERTYSTPSRQPRFLGELLDGSGEGLGRVQTSDTVRVLSEFFGQAGEEKGRVLRMTECLNAVSGPSKLKELRELLDKVAAPEWLELTLEEKESLAGFLERIHYIRAPRILEFSCLLSCEILLGDIEKRMTSVIHKKWTSQEESGMIDHIGDVGTRSCSAGMPFWDISLTCLKDFVSKVDHSKGILRRYLEGQSLSLTVNNLRRLHLLTRAKAEVQETVREAFTVRMSK